MATQSPAIQIRNILAAAMPSSGYSYFAGGLYETPDAQVLVRHAGGRPGEVAVAIDYPAIQLIVRGGQGQGKYEDAYDQVIACRDTLVRIPSHPALFPLLDGCKTLGDVLDLGQDDKSRPMFSLNLSLIISYPSGTGYRI